MFYPELFTILVVTAIAAGLVYFKIPVSSLQQLTILLLIFNLVFLSRTLFARGKAAPVRQIIKVILIFLTALLTQVVIISTGGFYSPLLIIIHLYTLASGFLLRISTAITFLILTLSLLSGQLFWDASLQVRFKEDPGIAAVYFASFIIIIPLAQFVMKTYNLKDKMTKILGEYLHIGQQREESILSGLNELVFITDKDLKLVSMNESASQFLKLSNSQIIRKALLDVLVVTTNQGQRITSLNLPIKNILEDLSSRIVKDMYLFSTTSQKIAITIQIKPIKDNKDIVKQLIFIIKDSRLNLDIEGHHKNLQSVMNRYQQSLNDLRQTLLAVKSTEAQQRVEILSHIEEDMRLVLEMEDHPLKERISFEDIALVGEQSVNSKLEFASRLGVNLQFIVPTEEVAERSWLDLNKQKIGFEITGKSDFTAPVDPAWLKLLIQKLLDVSILLVSTEPQPRIELIPTRSEDYLFIKVIVYTKQVTKNQTENLFIKNYGELENITNLKLGSGIEGFLAQAIAVELNLLLTTKVVFDPASIVFTLSIPMGAK